MGRSEAIRSAAKLVEMVMKGNDASHDAAHVFRVRNLALSLALEQGLSSSQIPWKSWVPLQDLKMNLKGYELELLVVLPLAEVETECYISIHARSNPSKEQCMKKDDQTTVNHFHEKLFKLKDLMETEAGRRRAEKWHKFMEEFLEELYREWDGKA